MQKNKKQMNNEPEVAPTVKYTSEMNYQKITQYRVGFGSDTFIFRTVSRPD